MLKKYKNLPVAVKSAMWFTICNLLQKAISLISTPIFTRILSTDEYGTYTVFISWESIISIFATLNLSYYVFNKGMVKFEDDRDNFVFSLQTLGSVACIILFLVYILAHNFFDSIFELSTPVMCMMFLWMLFDPATKYWSAKQRFEFKYQKLVIVTIAMAVLNPVLGILMTIPAEDKAVARIISVVLSSVVFGIVFYIYQIHKGSKREITKYWKYALTFNIPLIPHFLTSIILNNADRIMIKKICGGSYAAIYGVAYSAAMIMVLVNNALHQSLLPWLYPKMKNGDCAGVGRVFDGTLLLVAGINLLLIAFAPEVIFILAPSTYHSAIWIIPSVGASVYFIYLYNLFANVEMYFEESKLITIASVGIAALNIVLNYIFINIYGFLAAGYTTIFCYIMFSVVHYFMMKYVCKKHAFKEKLFNMRSIIVISLTFIFSATIILVLYKHTIPRYIFIGVLLIVAIVFRKRIIELIKSIKRKRI